jgi:hypothetical protein
VQVGVVLELLAPGVEDCHATDLGPQMFGIASNIEEGLRDTTKQQGIELLRVLKDQGREVLWQGKNPMDVGGL